MKEEDDDDQVQNKHYELRKALKATATDDNTVILTILNEAWAEPNGIFDVFLESFRIGKNTARLLNHLLVIAVDNKAYARCQALVPHSYFLKGGHSIAYLCFLYIRSNNRTIKFYKSWRSSRWKQPSIVEQLVLYSILRHSKYIKKNGLKVPFLDAEYLMGFVHQAKIWTRFAQCMLIVAWG
ncbi:hypothetical protein Cgig2_001804 [Carnegiea gigantea]|uniref:Nucleotide-diphospho-sugar transferase domain-containing protein n=1 Tax=Carnegiea gigantea TaxID=171969 RepID=A0A9Q1QIF7_9CARY|nr:hypothetical protein Cgig2_001804 [Carnegiea gigantea]